jgi:hypothetical protein
MRMSTKILFQIGALALLGCVIFGSAVMLGESGVSDLALRSLSGTDPNPIAERAKIWTYVAILILVSGIIVVSVINSSSTPRRGHLQKLRRGPDASNLFLGFEFERVGGNHSKHVGHLRTLAMYDASFVTNKTLTRGDEIIIHTSTLPSFAQSSENIRARISKLTPMTGEPKFFLAKLKFTSLNDHQQEDLAAYLFNLSDPKTAYQQL